MCADIPRERGRHACVPPRPLNPCKPFNEGLADVALRQRLGQASERRTTERRDVGESWGMSRWSSGLTLASRPRFRTSISRFELQLYRSGDTAQDSMVLGINTVVGAVGGVVGKLLPGSRKEATLIDGKKIAATITAEVKADVDKIRAQTGKVRAQR